MAHKTLHSEGKCNHGRNIHSCVFMLRMAHFLMTELAIFANGCMFMSDHVSKFVILPELVVVEEVTKCETCQITMLPHILHI